MKFQAIFFLLILTCMYMSMAQGSYGNCCLRHAREPKKFILKKIIAYRRQETDGDCNIRAIVFTWKKPSEDRVRTICAKPDAKWAIEIVEKLNNKTKIPA